MMVGKMAEGQRFASVWDAIENTPKEAENMKLRSALMVVIQQYVNGKKLTQSEAAKVFGVTRPRMSGLMRGKVSQFSLDALVTMASAAGMSVAADELDSQPAAPGLDAAGRRAARIRLNCLAFDILVGAKPRGTNHED